VALPLHAEYGTDPNVFYVPPMSSPKFDAEGNPTGEQRIPLDYLEYLFGPTVKDVLAKIDSERERVRNGEESELMDLLIARKWLDLFGPFTRHPRDVVTASPVRIVDPAGPQTSSVVQTWDAGGRA
jgi:hypothetical protein